MIQITLDNSCVGKIISEHPFVKLLSIPKCEIHETLPGIAIEQWTALAQVNESLAIIEVKLTK
jgi:hypothetical protein